MTHDAKKIIAIARTEGTEELYRIQCDTCVLEDNGLVAVLEWGEHPGHGGMRYINLRPELLQPSNDRIPQRIPASSNISRLALQRTRILLSADFNRLAHSFSLPAAELGR